MPGPAEPPRHLLHAFSTFAVGGPQTRFVALANALKDRYRHTVLAMDGNYAAAAGLDKAVDCETVAMPVVKSGGISLANLRNARAMLRRLRPDLLVTYNWGTIEWSLANWPAIVPHVHIEDGFGPDESPQRQNLRRVITRRLLLGRCARIIVPSHVLYDVATTRWRLPPRRVLHLPNGIDCGRFAVPPDRALVAALGLDENGPVVGTVAALRAEKNLKRLVRIFAGLRQALGARLVIVGDGPERAAIEGEAARLGVADRVILAGALANPERILGRFGVFVLTSDTEQMPNSILEAMAAGLAIVATDVGDLKRMVAPENAPFVLPGEPEAAVTGALERLLGDDALRERIAAANQHRAQANYRLETMVERYDAVFSGRDLA
jgi:glycosyltransferase involved in cell wall biosynthesis